LKNNDDRNQEAPADSNEGTRSISAIKRSRGKKIVTGVAHTSEEREACFKLRYDIYVDEMGKEPPGIDHARRVVFDENDEGAVILFAKVEDEVVGTARLISGKDGLPRQYNKDFNLAAYPELSGEGITVLSRFMLTRKWRRSLVFVLFTDFTYREGRRMGAWITFLDCAPSLVSLYESLGFRRYATGMVETAVGWNVPMVIIADDIDHLYDVGSPLLEAAKEFPCNPKHAQWFREKFPRFSNGSTARFMGIDEFSSFLGERVELADHPLFRGIPSDRLGIILKHGVLVHPKRDDFILCEGEKSGDIFIILEGAIELIASVNPETSMVLHTMGAGDVFGELAFVSGRRRMASARAISDSELLAITGASAEGLVASYPELAAPLFLNIARLLANRVASTTQSWIKNLSEL
jgi:hypothetical protein